MPTPITVIYRYLNIYWLLRIFLKDLVSHAHTVTCWLIFGISKWLMQDPFIVLTRELEQIGDDLCFLDRVGLGWVYYLIWILQLTKKSKGGTTTWCCCCCCYLCMLMIWADKDCFCSTGHFKCTTISSSCRDRDIAA